VPVVNNQRDGFHQMMVPQGRTAYHPNQLNGGYPMPGMDKDEGYVHYPENVSGIKIQQRSETFNDHFSQATLFWNSMSEPERNHIIRAFHFEVGKAGDVATRQKVVDMFSNVDQNLAVAIAQGVGAKSPASKPQTKKTTKIQVSKALSMANTLKESIKTRKIAILLMPGFNGNELKKMQGALTANGAKGEVISKYLSPVASMEGEEIIPDKNLISVSSVLYDAVYIPGGEKSIDALSHQPYVLDFVNEAFKHCKAIGATSEAVALLKEVDTKLQEAKMASDNKVVSDLGIVTSMMSSDDFTDKLIDAIAQHRHWARENDDPTPP
jgi:catalase